MKPPTFSIVSRRISTLGVVINVLAKRAAVTSPLEAGLGWVTKFNKEFTNSAALQQQKLEGVKRKLVGFEMIDRGIPRHDYPIVDADGNNIGKVTSGTQSPSLQKAIGMGYVQTEFAKEGTEIFIDIRNNKIKAKIVKPPFTK